jgi:hypothetical protein
MKTLRQIPAFKDDAEISAFMETHDGFALVDQGLAEIVETPPFSQQGKSYVELDPETFHLLAELVATGICADIQDAMSRAVHSYVLAVLPRSFELVREG